MISVDAEQEVVVESNSSKFISCINNVYVPGYKFENTVFGSVRDWLYVPPGSLSLNIYVKGDCSPSNAPLNVTDRVASSSPKHNAWSITYEKIEESFKSIYSGSVISICIGRLLSQPLASESVT